MSQIVNLKDQLSELKLEPASHCETSQRRERWVDQLAFAALALVALASIYDAWLVFKFREVIDEENQFCRWLISLEPDNVSVFLMAKLSGTALVVSVVALLMTYWRRVALPTVVGLVAFQLGLMLYLHTYDSVKSRYQMAKFDASSIVTELEMWERESTTCQRSSNRKPKKRSRVANAKRKRARPSLEQRFKSIDRRFGVALLSSWKAP